MTLCDLKISTAEFDACRRVKRQQLRSLMLHLLCIIASLSVVVAAESRTSTQKVPWKSYKNKSGIAIDYRILEADPYATIRATMQIDVSMETLYNKLMNINSSPQWTTGLDQVNLIEQLTHKNFIYSVIDTPWPLKNRDVFSLLEYKKIEENQILLGVREVGDFITHYQGFRRMPLMRACWDMSGNDTGVTLLYTAYADPDTSVPAWISNRFGLQAVMSSFKRLRQQLLSDSLEVYQPTIVNPLPLALRDVDLGSISVADVPLPGLCDSAW